MFILKIKVSDRYISSKLRIQGNYTHFKPHLFHLPCESIQRNIHFPIKKPHVLLEEMKSDWTALLLIT